MAEKRPVKITETILRDAHQSLIATRMPTELMIPIAPKMGEVGYHSVGCLESLRLALKRLSFRCFSVDRIS